MLLNLLIDILFEIIKLIDIEGVLRLSEVNKYMFDICSSNCIWIYFHNKYFHDLGCQIENEEEWYKHIYFSTHYLTLWKQTGRIRNYKPYEWRSRNLSKEIHAIYFMNQLSRELECDEKWLWNPEDDIDTEWVDD